MKRSILSILLIGAVGAGGGFLYGKSKESEQRAYQQGVQAGRSGQ